MGLMRLINHEIGHDHECTFWTSTQHFTRCSHDDDEIDQVARMWIHLPWDQVCNNVLVLSSNHLRRLRNEDRAARGPSLLLMTKMQIWKVRQFACADEWFPLSGYA